MSSLSQRLKITPKMLVLTVFVGLTTWIVLDAVQTRSLRELFNIQLNERLDEQAGIDRLIFDRYVSSFKNLVRVIGSQQQFKSYIREVGEKQWPLEKNGTGVKYSGSTPPVWLPPPSVLRAFAQVRYALLFDAENRIRECYSSLPGHPPDVLLKPHVFLSQLSHNQVFMTEIEGQPYLMASHFIIRDGKTKANLVVVSPLDSMFLMDAMGAFHVNDIVALVNRDGKVVASSRPDILAAGKSVDSVTGEYLVTGKSFFDYGSSNLDVQFSSLLSVSEYRALSEKVLQKERFNRMVTALALMLSFMAIILWITGRIRMVTGQISEASQTDLEFRTPDIAGGDEIGVLERSFQKFSREILASRQLLIEEKDQLEQAQNKLESKNIEIEHNRKSLQDALDEISGLIMEAASEKDFHVRFENPNIVKCNEILNCRHSECPCFGKENVRCWQQHSNAFCRDMNEAFQGKHGSCFECPVYEAATLDPIYLIGEQFNNMMHILELKNNELKDAYKELKSTQAQMLQQEKMASIGVLSAGVAHEINNPVGFIASNISTFGKYMERLREYIDLLQEKFHVSIKDQETLDYIRQRKKKLKIDYIVDDAVDLVNESLEGTQRVRDIVNNLKSFSRHDEAECKQSDINQCLENTLKIVWNELKYKAAIEKDYGELPLVLCMARQLNQVFMNLLINAVHAIEEKGIIRIKTRQKGDSVYVQIADTGRGIPPDKMSRIFEPFFTTKEVGKGTGLGLSISYDIVRKHGGEILVESAVGKGTIFTVRIPLAREKDIDKESAARR